MKPVIGDWYEQTNISQAFEVISFDEDDGTIEVQYKDGTVEEWEIDDWNDLVEDGELKEVTLAEDDDCSTFDDGDVGEHGGDDDE